MLLLLCIETTVLSATLSMYIQRFYRICCNILVFIISNKLIIMNLDLPFDTVFVINLDMVQVKDKNL